METFLVEGLGLHRMSWSTAYVLSADYRIKTSLALTRGRIRRVMEWSAQHTDTYSQGWVVFP